MIVIPLLAITDDMLVSTTVPEMVAATYNAGTEYDQGDLAGAAPVYGSPQTVWRSKQNSNTGHTQEEGDWWTEAGIVYPEYDGASDPGTGGIVSNIDTNVHELYEFLEGGDYTDPLTDESSWLYIGATNAWAMFDSSRSTRTTVPGSFTVVIQPGTRFDALALSGLSATSYEVSITSTIGGGEIFAQTGSIGQRPTLGWYDWFFGEFSYQESVLLLNLPPYSDSVITLTLTASSGNVALGIMVIGKAVDLGATQYSAESDTLNFSTIERDEFGLATLTARRNVPKTLQRVVCAKSRVNKCRQTRDILNATPAMWCGLDNGTDGYFDAMNIFGIYKKWTITMDQREFATQTLELEEL